MKNQPHSQYDGIFDDDGVLQCGPFIIEYTSWQSGGGREMFTVNISDSRITSGPWDSNVQKFKPDRLVVSVDIFAGEIVVFDEAELCQ